MVTADVELDLRLQLKEAGRLLLSLPESVDELQHILDQLEKLLSKVDQTPNNLMQEALEQPMKALAKENLLEHSSKDVQASVASCLCEITRITAPEAPYTDEEMKRIFKCIVSSFEDLSDKSSPSYTKRVSILETVNKVRACVIMLDLECDDLIVKLFEHFLNSVREHHRGSMFLLMRNIMALVIEESDAISPDMLKPLLASVKNNSEGVLPVSRELGEEVLKKSAKKLRPYLNKAVTILGNSLLDYSQVLTSICEGKTKFLEDNNESASVPPKVNGELENVGEGEAKKAAGIVDLPSSELTSKLDADGTVVEKSGNVESIPDTASKSPKALVSETVHSENIAEKTSEIVVAIPKPLEGEVEKGLLLSGSQQEGFPSQIQIKKGIRSKKKVPSQTNPPMTVVALATVTEAASDPEMRSPKRARKKTLKLETVGDSRTKAAKRSSKKVDNGGSVAKKPKLSGKEATESKKSKQDNKKVEATDSEVKAAKGYLKKDNGINSDAKPLKKSGKSGSKSKVLNKPNEDVTNKDSETESDDMPSKQSVRKVQKSKVVSELSEDVAKNDEEADSDDMLLKQAGKKSHTSKVTSKPRKDVANMDKEADSDAKLLKPSAKKGRKRKVISKPSEDIANKDEETESDDMPLKQAGKGKKGQKSKVSEDVANKDEETDSDNIPLKQSGKQTLKKKVISKPSEDEESDSDDKSLDLPENKDDEETDSDNIPLKDKMPAKKVIKRSSSVVKSSLKNKNGKKQGRGKIVEEKEQTKSLSEDDDGMNVSLKSALKNATKKKSNVEEALSTGSKRKRSATVNKVKQPIKFDESLIGKKVKVWWALDKMFYEGVVESFEPTVKKHTILYLDGERESVILKKERWEFIKKYSAPSKKVNVKDDVLPETVKEVEETKKVNKKEKPEKIVYERSKKGSKKKIKSVEDVVKESPDGDADEEPESDKEKSTEETPKIASKSGNKKQKVAN